MFLKIFAIALPVFFAIDMVWLHRRIIDLHFTVNGGQRLHGRGNPISVLNDF